jgi:hypothetical protein
MVLWLLCARERRLHPRRREALLNDVIAQAQEWGKRKAAESPRWQPDKWRRVATVFGLEVANDQPGRVTSGETGRAA